ncbi:formyl transferase domain-containing protein [Halorubrum coriense DSM 10284]|uniref:Formyl transferase domain-containing protein n=1 Tax=Halorubrum coriense DSM 10284 TaxID=1227466 RepID=M0EHE0_9EURY|nr:formyltransferase family protein [Halorubrum coriense]ELZ47191.1 formyl transferase domain-containing protein [Halorubrum coriense DSM 10284]
MIEIAFLGINDVGERIYDWLVSRDDTKVQGIFTENEQLNILKDIEPDLILSVGYRHIVPEEILEVPEYGAINLHKSYLPYNRGANPNVWSIIENNPAGTSIHYMTSDVDQGPIIDRQKVHIDPKDDARDLYERLEDTQVEQFKRMWDQIRESDVGTIEQQLNEGTYHYKRDFTDLWELNLDKKVRIGDFIDRLRALTFPPYNNAYFKKNGKKYYLEVHIESESDEVENSAEPKKVPNYTHKNGE